MRVQDPHLLVLLSGAGDENWILATQITPSELRYRIQQILPVYFWSSLRKTMGVMGS